MDLEAMKAATAQLDVSGIDFHAFRDEPLSAGAVRCLRYMHDVEYHTVCYLRDLLVTKAHRNHEVTSFLTFWNFEEYWHGEAIGRGPRRARRGRPRRAGGDAARLASRPRSRSSLSCTALGSMLAGPGMAGGPHDLGRGQRVDHPGRRTPGWPPGRTTRC